MLLSLAGLNAWSQTTALAEPAQSVVVGQGLASDSLPVQIPNWVILDSIQLIGNRKTRPHIILRELSLQPGDTLWMAKADSLLARNRNNIFNTNLFVTVDLKLVLKGKQRAVLQVWMEERWYLFPGPIFELSDRNFNEWWNTYNADLGRTNYGLRLVQENFRGRKEKLDLLFQFGFTQKFSLGYNIPYIDKKQRYGLNLNFSYSQNKSIAYQTDDHRLDFIESSALMRERWEARAGLSRRDGFYWFHYAELGFQQQQVADTVARLNPVFFLNGRNQQRYFRFTYRLSFDNRDFNAYPLQGRSVTLEFQRTGLGIFQDFRQTRLGIYYGGYHRLARNLFLANEVKGQVNFQPAQPYSEARALGFGDNVMRGFELYVIDGQGFAINNNTLRYRFFNFRKSFKFIPVRQFRTIPMSGYLTGYWDMGYVRDKYFNVLSNRFSNRFIFGWGGGIDLVTFYDLIIRFNYSLNNALEGGFFFGLNTRI
ncbi:MAG: BamA/TamA family outer membrane protein [Microscillaceae bacterium]|nr:BamA/TamA family outer membrane protein [Microscillaceae bacterium]